MAAPYLSWSCSMADCQLRLSVLYGTMQVHYVLIAGPSPSVASILMILIIPPVCAFFLPSRRPSLLVHHPVPPVSMISIVPPAYSKQ